MTGSIPNCSECSLLPGCPVGLIHEHALESGAPTIATARSFEPGQHLHRPGELATRVHVVQSGMVKSYAVTASGHEHVRGFHMGGDLVDTEAFDRMQYTGYVQALAPSILCSASPQDLLSHGEAVPHGRQHLVRRIAQNLMANQQHTYLLTKLSARQRLAAFLCELARRVGHTTDSGRQFHLAPSRRDIANYLGLTVETISRVMSSFQSEGILAVRDHHVIVRDAAALRERAEPQPGRATSRPQGGPSSITRGHTGMDGQ